MTNESRPRLHYGSYDSDLPEDPSPISHPARLLAAFGTGATLIGALLLPWFDYGVDSFHSSLNGLRGGNAEGLRGDTWGVYAIVVALGLIAAVASRSAAESRTRWVQLLLPALGVASLLVYAEIWLEVQQLTNAYRGEGYEVSSGAGLEAMFVGAIVCAVGGTISSLVTMRASDPDRSSDFDAPEADGAPEADDAPEA
jgi:hypothetical protein